VLPTVFGEKAVLRLLAAQGQVEDYAAHFGMNEEVYRRFSPLLSVPNGMIYLTGPTGSGKSTTLYMILEHLSKVHVNISTIEDPVEKNLPRVNQTQVNTAAGLTFEKGLRAILRQDPDVIMVGETRDGETAEIAVRAAITGHLVFSTLHTNSAVSSVLRLADMGVEPYLIANSLVGVVAQRLLRKTCPDCGTEEEATEEEKALWGASRVRRGRGCPGCGGTGYRGRIAIHELLTIDRPMRRMIAEGKDMETIEAYARKNQGLRTLREQAAELVCRGVTTPEEAMRIVSYE
jgi:type IV pilus assembly protein PilB